MLRFVSLGPGVTKFPGFFGGRMCFPAAPVGAAGKHTLKALEQHVEGVTPGSAPGGPSLAKALPLLHYAP